MAYGTDQLVRGVLGIPPRIYGYFTKPWSHGADMVVEYHVTMADARRRFRAELYLMQNPSSLSTAAQPSDSVQAAAQ